MERPAERESEEKLPVAIGPYKIEGLLGKGGMSILYLSSHPENRDIPVTIKVLSPKYLSNREVVRRFLREAEVISLADHPNIVKLYDQGEWEGGLYIAMEFIEGITLRQHLLQRPLSLKQALNFIVDIAFALCHLHTHGVIHRDLKPENILVDESKCIKVIDFGTAQLLFDEKCDEKKRAASPIIGTPIYMSPEQIESPDQVSYPSDIYSLAIVGYELITGRLCHGKVHLAMLPLGLQKIFSKALQPNPKNRYSDIVDFITDISNYMQSPNFSKEGHPIDQLSELADSLAEAESLLLPNEPPRLPNVDVAYMRHKGYLLSGIYYDIFPFEGGDFSLICLEPLEKGVQSLLFTAVVRGMVKALVEREVEPSRLLFHLNELLFRERIPQKFHFTLLYSSSEGRDLHFSTSGGSPLFFIEGRKKNLITLTPNAPPLGSSLDSAFAAEKRVFSQGETFLLTSYSEGLLSNVTSDAIKIAALDNCTASPEKLVAAIKNKLRVSAIDAKDSITLIAVQK